MSEVVTTPLVHFDQYLQQMKEQGKTKEPDFIEGVNCIRQSLLFDYDRANLIEIIERSTSALETQEAINNLIEDYFLRVRQHFQLMNQVLPQHDITIYDKDDEFPFYRAAVIYLKEALEREMLMKGMSIIDAIYWHDPASIQEAIQNHVIVYAHEAEAGIASSLTAIQGMETGPLQLEEESGRQRVRYWARNVMLPTELPAIRVAYEMVSGHSFLVEDENGVAHIITVPLQNTARDQLIEGKTVSIEEFDTHHYFGEPVSAKAMNDYFADTRFYSQLEAIVRQSINLQVLPIYGRVRFREMFYNPETHDMVVDFLYQHRIEGLFLFNSLTTDELEHVIPALNKISGMKIVASSHGQLEEQILDLMVVQNIAQIYEEAPRIVGLTSVENRPILDLLEKRMKKQILELQMIIDASCQGGQPDENGVNDIEVAALSFIMLANTAIGAVRLAQGKELPMQYERKRMPPNFIMQVYDFSTRHPQATAIYQAAFEFVTMVMMAQEEAPQIDQFEARKPDMYLKLAQKDKLEDVPTTDTETDTARAISIIEDCVNKEQLPKTLKILFVGMNKGKRFEKKVVEALRNKGIVFEDIVGIDQNDFADEARENVGIPEEAAAGFRYYVGNLQLDEFPELETEEGKVDIIILPWSMLNDLLKPMSFPQAILKLLKYLNQNGILMTDNPFPAGPHSYLSSMKEHAEQGLPFGHVLRTLEGAEEDIETMFKIYFMQYLTTHFMALGCKPLNFPASIGEQTLLARRIAEDDGELAQLHESGADRDAVKYSIYQVNGANRMTLAVQLVGIEEIMRVLGIFPMMLYEGGVKPLQEAKKRKEQQ